MGFGLKNGEHLEIAPPWSSSELSCEDPSALKKWHFMELFLETRQCWQNLGETVVLFRKCTKLALEVLSSLVFEIIKLSGR